MKNKLISNSNSPIFNELVDRIRRVKQNMAVQINSSLLELYWSVGETISKKVESEVWGKGVVKELAEHISTQAPDIKGFSDKNLWRMKQFYETYRNDQKLSALARKLSWTQNTIIFSRCKSTEERAFYLHLTASEHLSKRELDRQISSSLYERSMGNIKLSPPARELYPQIKNFFKDNYILEFMDLPIEHNEKDLKRAIVSNMKQFILELGKDFIFIGEEYRLQVGNQDFYIDLLFFHRGLAALVAFELKIGKFTPQHLGQLNFYLEALDRDVRKEHENPSIGVLLCRDKDDEVVEYALSRNLSPTLVAEYKLQLPDKTLLRNKLHELLADLPEGDDE